MMTSPSPMKGPLFLETVTVLNALGLHLLFPKSCLIFYSTLLQKLNNYAFRFTIIPKYFWKLPRLQVASLASRWYLHFLLISGGFGAFTISSRLVHGIFFYRLRQLPIANYSYAESIPPFLSLNCCAKLIPRPCLTGNESRAVKCCLLFPHCSLRSRMPITPQIMPE